MKLIEPSVEILEQSSGLNGIYEQIEIAGRTCYKSEPTYSYFYTGKNPHDGGDITVQVSKEFDGEKAIEYAKKEYLNGNPSYSRKSISAKTFVDRMVASKHYAMLEHGTIYLLMPCTTQFSGSIPFYTENKYTNVVDCKINDEYFYAITTNYRVLVEGENNPFTDVWKDLKELQCEPTTYHEKRITSKFVCDRGVSHEIVRHRVFSFAQESTRYCNYSKDKFGNELTFIKPSTLDNQKTYSFIEFYNILETIEKEYLLFLEEGWKPQEARAILPNCLKTEIVMTGFESDYDHFFELRCAKVAHPDMQVLANKLKALIDEEK